MLSKSALQAHLKEMKTSYNLNLDQIANVVKEAQKKASFHDRISTHDGFNLSASCGKLQELAAQIQLVEQFIQYGDE